jgi:steroid 5-alpha reductase family enzyme
MTDLIYAGACALIIALLALWIISVGAKKVSFIDAFWATGFIVVAYAAASHVPELGANHQAGLVMLTVWGARLSLYLLKRFFELGEDPRYIRMTANKAGIQRHFFTLWFVFGLQGFLILLISAPVFALLYSPASSLNVTAYIGIAIWFIGICFEWIGDLQLSRFRKNPDNANAVLDTGLWAWTRHPNYFGDACVWWGIWVVSGSLYAIYAPALMTFLLMKWSGVPLLEKSLKKRRPKYADYCARTSSFFPLPPKTQEK